MTRWWAPGRINLIGEHTDYNDGFVLPFALGVGCVATVEDAANGLCASSVQVGDEVCVRITGLAEASGVPTWSRYVLGAAWLLADAGVEVPPLRITVDSDVPLGAGLSSSAALVCSVVSALDDHLGLALSDDELLVLSRRVENDVVDAPTGGMDQLVSLRGVAGHALLCDMRSLTTQPLPLDLAAVGLDLLVVDTRAPHRHVDGEYAARRRGCEAAATTLGVRALRDVADLDAALARLDDEEQRRLARHVVTENARVLEVADLLRAGDVAAIGSLLTASHASMRDDFRITVPEVDTAVEALLDAGALGARMTGGGFGGCVIALVGREACADAESAVRTAFEAAGFADPVVFSASPQAGAHRL
jgi:galactokinase